MALSQKYDVPLENIVAHINDLLHRFTNAALMDTCMRVGGDPGRKLSADDRLIGSSLLAIEQGITPAYIAVGAAAGLHRYINEAEGMEQGVDAARSVLADVSKLDPEGALAQMILSLYAQILDGKTVAELRRIADGMKAQSLKEII